MNHFEELRRKIETRQARGELSLRAALVRVGVPAEGIKYRDPRTIIAFQKARRRVDDLLIGSAALGIRLLAAREQLRRRMLTSTRHHRLIRSGVGIAPTDLTASSEDSSHHGTGDSGSRKIETAADDSRLPSYGKWAWQ